ncbi:MAG: cation:proton antiporter [bacterium]
MESGFDFLLDLALILLSTKLLGLFTKKIHMPQVVGALVAGLVLGPAGLGWLKETDFISSLAEVGVIILMFSAGLESDLSALKTTGKKSIVIALLGVFVPLIGGTLIGFCFNGFDATDTMSLLKNIFIGVILTATSVSITVETLKEMGKLNTEVANTILGAALIDDILGIVILTIVSSFADPDVNILHNMLLLLGFFVFAITTFIVAKKLFNKWFENESKNLRRYVIMSFVLCLLLAYISEEIFHVADITGAFLAGLILSGNKRTHYIENRISVLSYLLLSPIFFANIGIGVELSAMTMNLVWLTVALVIVAILTKQFGCFLGAKLCKMNNIDSMRVGAGMVCRGEVALIVAAKGAALAVPLISPELMGPIVIMVVVTTVLAPLLLQFFYRNDKSETIESEEKINSLDVKQEH